MSSTAISVISNRAMRYFNTNVLVTSKITTIYKTHKILQLKDIYNLEVRKFMYKHTNSQLPATFTNYYFKSVSSALVQIVTFAVEALFR